MKLVVGLGNPGAEYEWTRHNVGFLGLEEFLRRHRAPELRPSKNVRRCSLEVGGAACWFIEPQTFMNLSGNAVAPFARDHGIRSEETLILHDEADLEEGRLQLKKGGGTGGHNGLESIVSVWGESDFYRLRIGIGKSADRALADFVLERAPKKLLTDLASKAADALHRVFEVGPSLAMNEINRVALA